MTVDPEKCITAEGKDKDFRKAIMNMLELLKEDLNTALNTVCENTNSGMEGQKQFKK